MNTLYLQFLLQILFLTIIFLHISKKNFGAVLAYCIQSLAIVLILFNSFFKTGDVSLLLVSLLIFTVKVVLAPIFFTKLIQKHKLIFSVSTYLNTPLTFIVISALTFAAYSKKFIPLTNIIPNNQALLSLAVASILLSLFLIVNRKGALSQIIGILSLENGIVAFAIFAGLEQSPSFQAGIISNIFIWIIISTVFASKVYEHFGSLDITHMKNLKD